MVFYITNLGYSKYNFDRTDLKCGAYGGKPTNSTKIKKTPVIFIHGNSDARDSYEADGSGSDRQGHDILENGRIRLALFIEVEGLHGGAIGHAEIRVLQLEDFNLLFFLD